MKNILKVFAALLLSAIGSLALAQRGADGIDSFRNRGNDSATTDSQRALVLQATDDERKAFANCMAATEAARKTGRSLGDQDYWNSWHYRHLGYNLNAVYARKDQLQSALANMTAAHQGFLEVLSRGKTTEIGRTLSKLESLQGELTLQMAQLNEELAAAKPDPFRVSTRLYGIGKSIDKWRSEHRKIAKEMNISRWIDSNRSPELEALHPVI